MSAKIEVQGTEDGNFEVLLTVKTKPRRLCLCTHIEDAEDIAIALRHAHKDGLV